MRYRHLPNRPRGCTCSSVVSLLLFCSAASAQTLVGHWKMDDGSGPTIVDSSASGNNGTLFGNPTFVAGKDNLALSLDGNTGSPLSVDYARIPDSASLDITGPITLSAWVNPARTATQSLIRKVDGTGIGTTTVAAYEIVLSTNHFVSVRFNGDDTKRVNSNYIYDNCPQATCPVCPPGGCTNLNTWFHVAATYDGATIRLYINGVLDQSLANAFTINNNNIDLTIGADVSGSDARDLQGLVDDVRIYNGTLSANEIRDLACVGNAGASVRRRGVLQRRRRLRRWCVRPRRRSVPGSRMATGTARSRAMRRRIRARPPIRTGLPATTRPSATEPIPAVAGSASTTPVIRVSAVANAPTPAMSRTIPATIRAVRRAAAGRHELRQSGHLRRVGQLREQLRAGHDALSR